MTCPDCFCLDCKCGGICEDCELLKCKCSLLTGGEKVSKEGCMNCFKELGDRYIQCHECICVLCCDCFAKGTELRDHKSDHSFSVVRQDLSVLAKNWTAVQELQLLDSVLQFGYGNWAEIARTVAGKNEIECKEHFEDVYVEGGTEMEGWSYQADRPAIGSSTGRAIPMFAPKDDPPRLVLGSNAHRDLANYNPARADFGQEMDDRAEVDVAKVSEEVLLMPTDGDDLIPKLEWTVLEIYNSRLKQRNRRKRLIKEHSLLHRGKLARAASRYSHLADSGWNYEKFLKFSQILCAWDLDYLLESLSHEASLRRRTLRLQKLRGAGLRLLGSASVYTKLCGVREEQAKQLSSGNVREWIHTRGATQFVRDAQLGMVVPTTSARARVPLDIVGLPGYEKTTEAEREICSELRVLPATFLEIKQVLTGECTRLGGLRLADARPLVKIDVNKTRKIYDFLVAQGLIWLKTKTPGLPN